MEILIQKIDPAIPIGRPERVLEETVLAKLPDRSGTYTIGDQSLTLDLSLVKYTPGRVTKKMVTTYVWDEWDGYPVDKEVDVESTVRSWPVTLTSEMLAANPRDPNTDKYREDLLKGVRVIPVNRKGIGRQTIPGNRDLVIRLQEPIISSQQEADGKWVQIHYYPDYPEMSGTLEYIRAKLAGEEAAKNKLPEKRVYKVTRTIQCCEGHEQRRGECEKGQCPLYQAAKSAVDGSWLYVGTGFGNLYGNPSHNTYLERVKYNVAKEKPES